MTPDRATTSRDILAFYQEAGVDIAVGETPVDRFAAEAPPPERGRPDGEAVRAGIRAAEAQDPHPIAARSPPPFQGEGGAPAAPQPPRTIFARDLDARGRMTTPAAPDTAVMAAREAARRADSLDTLRAILNDFTGCALRATATQLVFADGNPQARVMFVGEAPGRDEDIEGLPFVGRSGKLLDQMLAAIGLDRSSVYIANIVPWRPPGNRTPTPQETSICLPFTQRQIELVDPDVLVCLGNPSMQTLLATKEGITKSRGRWFPFHTGKRDIRAMPSYHPAFLLRSPLQKRLAWRDFLAIKKELAKPTGR